MIPRILLALVGHALEESRAYCAALLERGLSFEKSPPTVFPGQKDPGTVCLK